MNPICILTDSAAQFPNPVFSGREHVHFFDLPLDIAEKREHENLVVQAPPEISIDSRENQKGKNASSQNAFGEILLSVNNTYDEIIILTASRFLNPSFSIIERMVTNFNGGARLFLIDTQTISTGQGFLVEQAARAVHAGVSVAEIERDIRKSIPRIFNILCTPSLFFLNHSGIIDQPQAMVSEFLNLYPIFVLEDGKFTPVNKVRNYHAAIESFQEFLEEFDHLAHISFLHGSTVPSSEIRFLKQFCDDSFTETSFSEHQLNPYLSAMFGTGFMGLFITE